MFRLPYKMMMVLYIKPLLMRDIFDLITFRIFYSGNEVDQLIQNWNFYANQEVEAGSINSIDSFMIDLDDNTTLDVHHIGVFKGDPQGQACN